MILLLPSGSKFHGEQNGDRMLKIKSEYIQCIRQQVQICVFTRSRSRLIVQITDRLTIFSCMQ
jgi:hypothetical protein